jgi:probable HAF family extracellular repeat protein
MHNCAHKEATAMNRLASQSLLVAGMEIFPLLSGHAADPDAHGSAPTAVPDTRPAVRAASIPLPPLLTERLKAGLGIPGISPPAGRGQPSSSANRTGAYSAPAGRASAPPQSTAPATARRYFVTDLGTLGGTQSFAYAINDSGQVVGSSRTTGDASSHAFLYGNRPMRDLYPLNSTDVQTAGPTDINESGHIASGAVVDGVYSPALLDSRSGRLDVLGSLGGVTPDGFNGVATSVNNQGVAVGYSYVNASDRHAFVYYNAHMTDIGASTLYSAALDVNDDGTVVGFASTAASKGRAHAFVYSSGVMTDINASAKASESYATSINSAGQVVGHFLARGGSAFHAFLYSDGAFLDIGLAGSPETTALSINDPGQIVGVTLVATDDLCFDPRVGRYVPCIKYIEHAFLYETGITADLNSLIWSDSGWELQWAFDINNHGQVVGYGLRGDRFRAFLLTPADRPEQCNSGAWKSFGFATRTRCVRFVQTGT